MVWLLSQFPILSHLYFLIAFKVARNNLSILLLLYGLVFSYNNSSQAKGCLKHNDKITPTKTGTDALCSRQLKR